VLTIYGIPNCDKCRAARKWFGDRGIDFQFHDVRKDGLTKAVVSDWLARAGHKTLINNRGKGWKDIPVGVRDNLDDRKATELILKTPLLVKRPLIDTGSELLVGYDEERWTKQFT
jgi:arsenate reductase